MDVVVDYVAETLPTASQRPTLLISGKYDFGAAAAENWHAILPAIENDVVLMNSAHYIHLEADAQVFGEILSDFMVQHDKND
jgi:pimeloyl-ACP methyl ester carboxylesterase